MTVSSIGGRCFLCRPATRKAGQRVWVSDAKLCRNEKKEGMGKRVEDGVSETAKQASNSRKVMMVKIKKSAVLHLWNSRDKSMSWEIM